MNLKRMPFWFLLFFFLSITASAQQATKADIEALATKVSSIEKTVNKIDQRLITVEKTVNDMDKRLISLETTVREMDRRLTNQIDQLDKRLTNQIDQLDKRLTTSINILIGIILAAIALPQVLGYLQSKRERQETQQQIQDLQVEMRQEIRDLGERLEQQLQMMFDKLNQHEQEIDELKSRRIVTPS